MIPKRIIQINYYNKMSLLNKTCQKNIIEISSNYEYIIYTEIMMYDFVKENYPQYLNIFINLSINNKIFLFVLLEIYKYGGIYLDINFFLYKSFDELLEYNITIFPLLNKNKIGNYCIISEQNNKFLLYLITKILVDYNCNNKFLNGNILYNLYTIYNKHIFLIISNYNQCFGNFGYYIENMLYKINSNYLNKYEYDNNEIINLKNKLFLELRWLKKLDYKLL